MKVTLINPNSRAIGRIAATNPSLGLLYIASYLREKGAYTVDFIDADVDNLHFIEISRRVKDADVIGISMVTQQAPFAYELLGNLKAQFPKKPIVIGGSHVSCFRDEMPKLFEECPQIDYAVYGEGELTMLQLCQSIENKTDPADILGIAFKNTTPGNPKDFWVQTNPPQPYLDINSLPFPAVDLAMPITRYKPYYPKVQGKLSFPIMSSRGCPFFCKFCGAHMVWGRTPRLRNPENIISEIKRLHGCFDVDDVFFMDDMLNFNNAWFRQLCQQMIDEGLKNKGLVFKGSIRANKNLCNYETFKLAKQAGFFSLAIGSESGDQQILDAWDKRLTVQEIDDCFAMLKKLGFHTVTSFIMGNPNDSRRSLLKTIKFAKKLNPDQYDFPLAVPLRNTDFYNEAKALGLIKNDDYKAYGMGNAVVQTKHLSCLELEALRRQAFWTMLPLHKKIRLRLRSFIRKLNRAPSVVMKGT